MTELAKPLRDRRWLARLWLTLAALTPVALLSFTAIFLLPRNLLVATDEPDSMRVETPAVLTAMMSDMVNLAIGLMLVGWFIYRRPVAKRVEGWHLSFALLSTAFGLISIFAGLRGQFALAFVISTKLFLLRDISGFIETQAGALVLQLMMTSLLASHFLIFRDRRITLNQ